MIQPGSELPGDIIHEVPTYLLPLRVLAGAIRGTYPRDRIIDGVDQTALLINGDTHSRRDHVFIYAGPRNWALW